MHASKQKRFVIVVNQRCLSRYEMEKQHAVDNEDYDLAKSLKFQIDEFRLKVLQQLRKHNLLEELEMYSKEVASSAATIHSQSRLLSSRRQTKLLPQFSKLPIYEIFLFSVLDLDWKVIPGNATTVFFQSITVRFQKQIFNIME